MAHITSNPTAYPLSDLVIRPLRAVGNFFIRIAENDSRVKLVNELNAMSDSELAKLGIKRDDIVRHVFKDCFYI